MADDKTTKKMCIRDSSYAYGWAISADYEGCIMQTLLDKADYCMYENKRAYYATHSP